MKQRTLTLSFNPTLQKTFVLPRWERGEVTRALETHFSVAGKGGNIARIIAQLGGDSHLLSQGGGLYREFFRDSLESDGVQVHLVESGAPIRTCSTLLYQGEATEIVEEGPAAQGKCEEGLWQAFLTLLPRTDLVIAAGSQAVGLDPGLTFRMLEAARREGRELVLDFQGSRLKAALELKPRLVKIALYEFIATFLPEERGEQRISRKLYPLAARRARELHENYGTGFILTNGGEPVLGIDEEGVFYLDPPKAKPVNPIGCGDAFTAGAAAALGCGLSLREGARWGAWCAARNLEQLFPGTLGGSTLPFREDLPEIYS